MHILNPNHNREMTIFYNMFCCTDSVRKFQVQLRQVTLAADERTKQLEAKVEELEAQNLSQGLEIRELERENRQMHEMLEARNPWIAQLTQERNKTAKELKHAQAVIADLLGRLKVCFVALLVQS